MFVVLGVFIESVFSDRLFLSLCLHLAKLNNCFRPPAFNEGCGKSIFLKILARTLCFDQLYGTLLATIGPITGLETRFKHSNVIEMMMTGK